MPIFEVEHNGQVYEVDAADENAAASAFDSAPAQSRGPQSRPTSPPLSALDQLRQMSPGQQAAAGGRTALELAGRTALAPIGAAAGLLRGAGTAIMHPLGGQDAGAAVGDTMRSVQGLIPQTLGSRAMGEAAQQGFNQLPGGAQGALRSAGNVMNSSAAQPFIAGAELLGAGAAIRGMGAARGAVSPTQRAVAEIHAQGGAVPRAATFAPESASGAAVQRVARAGRDTLSGEIATRGVTSKLNETNRRAILRHAGIDADRATPEVLSDARERIGGVFENIYDPSVTVPQAPVAATINNISQNMPIAQGSREAVEAAVTRINESFANGGGNITGRSAKELRAWLMTRRETAFKGQAIDAAESFDELIEGLDDAVFAVSPPGAQQAIGTARLQWRNFKAIENATDRGLSGEISPRKLASYLSRSKYTKRAYAANEPGTLESLARAFDTLQDKFPNSGTASRAASMAEPVAALASGGGTLPASVANMATQRYLAGPAGPLMPTLQGPSKTALGVTGLLGNYPYEDEL